MLTANTTKRLAWRVRVVAPVGGEKDLALGAFTVVLLEVRDKCLDGLSRGRGVALRPAVAMTQAGGHAAHGAGLGGSAGLPVLLGNAGVLAGPIRAPASEAEDATQRREHALLQTGVWMGWGDPMRNRRCDAGQCC